MKEKGDQNGGVFKKCKVRKMDIEATFWLIER